MILCSALYYPASLANPAGLVRDNRYYGGKAAETFPVWWQYVRKHYPDVEVVLFADVASPIPLAPILRALPEQWEEVRLDGQSYIHDPYSGFDETEPLVTVRWLDQHSGGYFRPMQRNLVEAMCLAYRMHEDLLWIDADCFCNTNLRPLIAEADVASSNVEAHQMTMGSVCFYLSSKRLHALDGIGIDLPMFLRTMFNEGPTETRMHTLQEGGLYKLFAYGNVRDLGRGIQLSHLSCYDRFMTFLRRNPLDTSEYQILIRMLEAVDWSRMSGVERTFHDMLYPENAYIGS